MKISFNLENLNKLLFDFYRVTGLTVSVWDVKLNQLSFRPRKMPDFCKLIKSSPLGNRRCFLSDKEICQQALRANRPVTHRCHAGLIDTAVPIQFKSSVLGFLMFGQVTDKNSELVTDLSRLSRELKLEEEALTGAFALLERYDPEKISSAAHLLTLAARSLWLSDMIGFDRSDLAVQLDDYIRANIASRFSVEDLCKHFSLSKNKLYHLSRESFGDTIGNYITNVRIELAKHYLTTSDLQINEIAPLVGIDDYNYFSKLFRQKTGYSPTHYRKNFPFTLTKAQDLPTETAYEFWGKMR